MANDNTDAVLEWLQNEGVPSSDLDVDGNIIIFKFAVNLARDLLCATFHEYRSSAGGGDITRTLGYSVPKDLFGIIQTITPTIQFP